MSRLHGLAGLLAVLAAFIPWCIPAALAGEPAFAIPPSYRLVNDFAHLLTIEQGVEVTAKLQALERSNGTQIVLLSVPSIGDESPWDYAVRAAERWDIGNNGQGNGVLVLLVPGHAVQILTGAGIAGALPDAKVARIIRETMEPRLQRGDIEGGILATIDELIAASRAEQTAPTSYA